MFLEEERVAVYDPQADPADFALEPRAVATISPVLYTSKILLKQLRMRMLWWS